MAPPLHASLLRFWQPTDGGRTVAGTGFLAVGADGKAYALTCAHVADRALRLGKDAMEAAPSGATTADLVGRGEVTLDLVARFAPLPIGQARGTAVADIAVFAPRNPLSAPFVPPLRVEPPGRIVPPGTQVDFYSFGFMGTDDGTPASGALRAEDAGGWFVADGDAGFRRFIEEGLSGAPIYANGTVLGMVTQRLEREVKQGLVIPALALAQAWPPLAQPYPGLPAFDAATAHLYFGRGRPLRTGDPPTGQLKQLVERLEAQRLVGLMGSSGSGKSSLAKAGVAPLYEQRGWVVLGFRPGLNPLQNLAETIATELENAPPGPERVNAIERWVPRLEAGNLAITLDAIRARGAVGTLIVIDQFEEFFTADPVREAEIVRQRGVLLPQLLAAALDRRDVLCLLTGRLDLIELMVSGDRVAARMLSDPLPPYVLTAMSMNEVTEAIARPAEVFGVKVDPVLIAELAAETARAEGQLPLLQAALRQAWSGLMRTPGDSWRVGRPDLPAETGLLDGAVRAQADMATDLLRRGRSDRPGIAEDDLRRVLVSLVRLEGRAATRRLLLRAETEPTDWAILEALAEHRLVTLSGEEGTAELVHESMMTAWPMLADLIASHADFLLWRAGFDRDFLTWKNRGSAEDYLLRRQDVAIALNWLENKRRDLPPPVAAEKAFITASRDYHDRRTRELEALLAQARTAEAMAKEARNAALLQESRALAAWAKQESARGDHLTAVLLALEALPEPGRGGDRPVSAEAAAALRQAWMRNREICLAGHTRALRAASFSADGRHVVTASDDGTARVWDLSGRRPAATVLEGHTDCVLAASFSADGRRVVTASLDGTARVWDLSGPHPSATVLKGHVGPVRVASFSADGRRVVTASYDCTARVWDLSGAHPTATVLEGHTDCVRAASFSADGRRVVTASDDGTARVWDLSGPHPAATVLEGHRRWCTVLRSAPTGAGSSPRLMTARRGCGTCPARTPPPPCWRATRVRWARSRSAPTGAGSSPRLMTARRGCGTCPAQTPPPPCWRATRVRWARSRSAPTGAGSSLRLMTARLGCGTCPACTPPPPCWRATRVWW